MIIERIIIKQLREFRGKTQHELANLCELEYQVIQRWEQGRGRPSIGKLRTVLRALDFELELIAKSKTQDEIGEFQDFIYK